MYLAGRYVKVMMLLISAAVQGVAHESENTLHHGVKKNYHRDD
jgi:hypothetical protein